MDTGGEGTEVLAGTNTITPRLDYPPGKRSGDRGKRCSWECKRFFSHADPGYKNSRYPGNLVHGSDHGGNKSQAAIPGQSGQGSLSNLKLVEGSKAGGKEGEKTTREIKASLKLQGEKQTSLFGNIKTADTQKDRIPEVDRAN